MEDFSVLPLSPAGILLRHAEREPIAPGTFGNDVNLTTYGKESCLKISSLLKNNHVALESSPVKRCVETAALLSNKTELSTIKTNKLLGDPGIFVLNQSLVQDYFIQYSPLQIVENLLSSFSNPPGFCLSTSEAIRNLMDYMLVNNTKLKIFVTHDIILAIVLGYFFPQIPLKELWPDYLEGLIFWKNKNHLMMSYRNFRRSILW